MDEVEIEGLVITPLKIIPHPQGDIFHGIKTTDPGFAGFGEAYFSFVNFGEIKAWKKHRKMTVNLVVPIGEVLIAVYDDRPSSPSSNNFFSVILSPNNYQRITIPENLWLGFKGIQVGINLILNIANLEHDPQEMEKCPLETFPFDWNSYEKILSK